MCFCFSLYVSRIFFCYLIIWSDFCISRWFKCTTHTHTHTLKYHWKLLAVHIVFGLKSWGCISVGRLTCSSQWICMLWNSDCCTPVICQGHCWFTVLNKKITSFFCKIQTLGGIKQKYSRWIIVNRLFLPLDKEMCNLRWLFSNPCYFCQICMMFNHFSVIFFFYIEIFANFIKILVYV